MTPPNETAATVGVPPPSLGSPLWLRTQADEYARMQDAFPAADPEEEQDARRQIQGLRDAAGELDRLNNLYYDLILAVESKHPGEMRHETALRYIREREERTEGPSQANTGGAL